MSDFNSISFQFKDFLDVMGHCFKFCLGKSVIMKIKIFRKSFAFIDQPKTGSSYETEFLPQRMSIQFDQNFTLEIFSENSLRMLMQRRRIVGKKFLKINHGA